MNPSTLVLSTAKDVLMTDILGPDEGRYFGAGYRSVDYQETRAAAGGTLTDLRAEYAVRYPPGWSRDEDGRSRVPHLSSIDAAVLPLRALEQMPGSMPDGFYVRSMKLRSGPHPWTALEKVPLTMAQERAPGGQGWRLHGTVGNMTVTCQLSADKPTGPAPECSALLGGESAYGGLYRRTRTVSSISSFEATARSLRAQHMTTTAASADGAPGVEGRSWPCLTVVDSLVVMGQLAQAAIVVFTGIDRARMGALWMRQVTYSAARAPQRLPHTWQSDVTLVRDRLMPRRADGIHDVVVECVSSVGVRVEAKLAYMERGIE